ncbi:acetylserotonin O-methyltransferase-like isoform X3 [Eleutherodactylus coqui]|uniref:acetylserotonin O-methyltransferase-like isoform X3 n=1 Tax=Eleutherodactylus coqui TaxID=57060 RepID=UPI003461CB1D
MSSAEELEYPQILLDYQQGFFISKIMFTACELGVFDLLHELEEPASAATIATRLSTSVDGMERLLNACVGLNLLKVDLKNNEGYYSNTDVSDVYLVKSSPRTLYHMMMYYTQTVYTCCQYFTQAVRSEEDMVTVMLAMDSTWKICGKDVIQAFDLSVFRTVCDIGGCAGGLAKQFLSTYNESSVTIMDLPKVVQAAKKHLRTDEQIHFLEGDFFNDPIPEADLYIMARIIHDWTEEKCLKLLRKIYQSCKPGGAVLIVESLLNEDKSGPIGSLVFSLSMLVHAEGKERTPSEYTKLLTDSGFRDIEVKVTGKLYDAILGRK